MTIQELYDWAKEHECLDIQVVKHLNGDFFEVNSVCRLGEEIPGFYNKDLDRVVID